MTIWQDLRYAVRQLCRSPGFTAAAVLSLALGIGANTAIFTFLDQVLLRPLPVQHPEQLALLSWGDGPTYGVNIGGDALSYPMYRDFRDGNKVFSDVMCRFRVTLSVGYRGQTERVDGELVSGNYFDLLGVGAALGRTFTPQDDRVPGGHPLTVLSYQYWVDRFHMDRGVLGQSIIVDGVPLTVIGVSQKGFDGVQLGISPKIRIPVAMKAQMTQGYFSDYFNLENRRAYWVNVFGRLKPGVTLRQAQASLQPMFHSILEMEVREKGFETASARTKQNFVRSTLDVLNGSQGRSSLTDYETPLRVLMAIVGVVLLIACANVANLLLARAAGRRREIAVRLAVGASSWHVARQALAESSLLAFAGGASGLLLAMWMDQWLLGFIPAESPINLVTTPDLRILSFTLAVCLITGLLFGLAPALASRRVDLAPALKEDARTVAGGKRRFRRILIVAQVSLSALLLISAVQFLRTLVNLHHVDTGLQTRNVFAFSVNPSLNGYSKPRSSEFYRALIEKMRATPGVESAGAAAIRVLDEDWWANRVTVDGGDPKSMDEISPNLNLVSSGYLATLGTPLLAGRDFSPADAASKQKVAIVNEAFVKQFLDGKNPIGRRLGLGNDPGTKLDTEIVGLMKDAKYYNVRSEIRPQVFLNDDQNPDIQQINMFVKARFDPRQLFAAVRRVIHDFDPNIPVFDMRTMDLQADLTLERERMLASLASAFGLLATVLAAVGLYGLMAFNVARRTREIGIRMALGARSGNVTWLVMKEVLALVTAGLFIAIPAAWALTTLVRSQLYGVSPNDPLSAIASTLTLAVVALLAGYRPAKRAMRINPVEALRSE
jgi:predicted permease